MLPISVFPGADKHPFTHARRVNPVYLRNPYKEIDEIKIKLPEGLQIESVPLTRNLPGDFADLKLKVEKGTQSLDIEREVTIKGYYYPTKYYPSLRQVLDKVKAMGDEQAVLRAAAK